MYTLQGEPLRIHTSLTHPPGPKALAPFYKQLVLHDRRGLEVDAQDEAADLGVDVHAEAVL